MARSALTSATKRSIDTAFSVRKPIEAPKTHPTTTPPSVKAEAMNNRL